MSRKIGGFSLIELLVTLVIVGLLATIAVPSYVGYLATSRRSDATGALMGLQAAMERYFTVNNTYKGAAVDGADTGVPLNYASTVPVSGGTPSYNLTIKAATATSFTIQAVPTGVQAGDKCGTLTLTSTGQRGMVGAKAGLTVSDCWRN